MDACEANDCRTLTELIIRTIAIHATTLIAVGHLGSLRQLPQRSKKWYLDVILFFFIPFLPFAQLVYCTIRSITNKVRGGPHSGDFAYHLAAALGVYASSTTGDTGHSVRLVDAEYKDLQRERSGYGRQWTGRVLVLLVFMVQAASTIALFARRVLRDSVSNTDERNALMAIGGLSAVITSIGITAVNSSWRYIVDPPADVYIPAVVPALAGGGGIITPAKIMNIVNIMGYRKNVDSWIECLLSGFLWLLWTPLSPNIFGMLLLDLLPAEVLSIPAEWKTFDPIQAYVAIILLFSTVMLTIMVASVPVVLLVFCFSSRLRVSGLGGVEGMAMAWIVQSAYITLALTLADLAMIDCSESWWRDECWKDPMTDNLWTF